MSEAEQNETPQRTEDEWVELESELAEVRKKRDQLDAQNLRVTENLRTAIPSLPWYRAKEERDKALANADSWRVEYLAAKESANTNSDNAAALQEQLVEMTAERDKAAAKWRYCCEDRSREVTALQEELLKRAAERDAALDQVATVTAERDAALADVRLQLAAKIVIIAERDAAERERTESRAEVVRLRVERDAARKFADDTQVELGQWQVGHDAIKEQLAQAKEAADMFEAKNIALRDTVRQLQAKQVHGDLPGLLMSIQLAAEQARLSI